MGNQLQINQNTLEIVCKNGIHPLCLFAMGTKISVSVFSEAETSNSFVKQYSGITARKPEKQNEGCGNPWGERVMNNSVTQNQLLAFHSAKIRPGKFAGKKHSCVGGYNLCRIWTSCFLPLARGSWSCRNPLFFILIALLFCEQGRKIFCPLNCNRHWSPTALSERVTVPVFTYITISLCNVDSKIVVKIYKLVTSLWHQVVFQPLKASKRANSPETSDETHWGTETTPLRPVSFGRILFCPHSLLGLIVWKPTVVWLYQSFQEFTDCRVCREPWTLIKGLARRHLETYKLNKACFSAEWNKILSSLTRVQREGLMVSKKNWTLSLWNYWYSILFLVASLHCNFRIETINSWASPQQFQRDTKQGTVFCL